MIVGGGRQHISRAAVRAATRRHYYQHPANRSRVYLPPRQVQELHNSLTPDVRAKLAEVGLQVADEIDVSKSAEDQLTHIEEIWSERFEAIVEPIAESMKEAVADAIESVLNQAADSEVDAPETEDEQAAMGWLATAVLVLSSMLSGGALGADLAQRKYSEAAKWAVTLIISVYALFHEENQE